MTDLFESFFGSDPWPPVARERSLVPAVNVSETDENIVVEAELPGIDPKDLEVSLKGDVLTLKGEKREENSSKGESWHRTERSFGSFTRSFRLNSEIDAEGVTSSYAKGVLTITLPKSESARGRSIPVNAS